MKLTKTKWVDHEFSPAEKKARAKWRRVQENVNDISAALRSYPVPIDRFLDQRQELHKRLDERIDVLVKTAASAKELFPEVDESFTAYFGKL